MATASINQQQLQQQLTVRAHSQNFDVCVDIAAGSSVRELQAAVTQQTGQEDLLLYTGSPRKLLVEDRVVDEELAAAGVRCYKRCRPSLAAQSAYKLAAGVIKSQRKYGQKIDALAEQQKQLVDTCHVPPS